MINNARILVTGGNGFLGSHIVDELTNHWGPAHVFAPTSAEYDLLHSSDQCVRDHEPDVIIHAAAVVGGIKANQAEPGRYLYANAIMGIQLLESVRVYAPQARYVLIGTACSYPEHAPLPFVETDLHAGYPEPTNAPYGLAKRVLISQVEGYRQQYGLNAISVIPANLYGPHDHFAGDGNHVIPAIIAKVCDAIDNQAPAIDLWGTGTATRDFLFVRDAARGIVMAADAYQAAEPLNIASGTETSIREVARLICGLAGYKGQLRWNADRPDGQPQRVLDATRARHVLGFTAQTSLREGLATTLAWYQQMRSLHAVRV